MVVNQLELATMLRVSPKTVQQWDREGLRDVARLKASGRSARYDAAAAFWWFHERELAAERAKTEVTDIDALNRRKLEVEVQSRELDLAAKRGDFVPMDELETLVRAEMEAVDTMLKHAPTRHAPELSKVAKISVKQARAVLRDVIESVRTAIRTGA